MSSINQSVLMSGADYFTDKFAINAYMDSSIPVQTSNAIDEHSAIKQAFQTAGIQVTQVAAPAGCQDGVYTANWALTRGKKAIMSSLPNKRKSEEPHARKALEDLGFEIIEPPFVFSGQGDALPCGNYLLAGSTYRTNPRMHQFVADQLGLEVISLQTIPQLDASGVPVINSVTGWPDSFFYDIDLALSVITPELIAWCPEAFTPESQAKIRALNLEKIEVPLEEAMQGFACNLVSTGETVIMSAHAPGLQAALEAKGFKTITPEISELAKGGGYIRCTSLTLSNT